MEAEIIAKVPLDEKDREILKMLVADPRSSVADIAREVGVQRDTVMYRIRRFETRGLISKYHTILEPQALGLSIFMLVLVKTAPVAGDVLEELPQKGVRLRDKLRRLLPCKGHGVGIGLPQPRIWPLGASRRRASPALPQLPRFR